MKTIMNELGFLKKKVAFHWNAWKKKDISLANKLIKNVPDSRNAKELYESFL